MVLAFRKRCEGDDGIKDVLCMVQGKILQDFAGDEAMQTDVFGILYKSIVDCFVPAADVGKFVMVCPHGRLARLLSTFDGVQEGWRVGVSNAMLRDMLGTMAARMRDGGEGRGEFVKRALEEFGAASEAAVLDMALGFD